MVVLGEKFEKKQENGLFLHLNKGKFLNLRKKALLYAQDNFNGELREIFYRCFFNTIDTTSYFENDGSVFVLTGDIPAMWLRDSVPQVMQYLFFAKDDEEVCTYLKGVMKKLFSYMITDPYANAFKRTEREYGEWDAVVKTDKLLKIVWERKFELDSICYPFFLTAKYYEFTADESCFDEIFVNAFDRMVETVNIERKHSELSTYYFFRDDELVKFSNPEGEKGLVWSGFRPSDDKCLYPYHIPDNMFLVSVLYKLAPIFENILNDKKRAELCRKLVAKLSLLIEKYGVYNDTEFGKIYVSETDCLGNCHFDDDANIPSLLSIPYLEYPFINKDTYENTRKFVLSKRNKYYYQGKLLTGIGSPHTPKNRVWPISLCMQAITSESREEINRILEMLIKSTGGTGYMHEGVDCDDASIYSRPWFAWANSLFAYMLLVKKQYIDND